MAADYRDVAIDAQKKAIARIRKSLPDKKRKKLDELLKPLLSGDGLFWDVDIKMLDSNRKLYSRDSQTVKRQISEITTEKQK